MFDKAVTIRRPRRPVLALALALATLSGCSAVQLDVGQVYNIRTPRQDTCPDMTWQFQLDALGTVHGSLLDSSHDRTGNLSGRIDQDVKFNMIVTDDSGRKTSEATGQFTARISPFTIRGGPCDGRTFDLHLGPYFARVSGGGNGRR